MKGLFGLYTDTVSQEESHVSPKVRDVALEVARVVLEHLFRISAVEVHMNCVAKALTS